MGVSGLRCYGHVGEPILKDAGTHPLVVFLRHSWGCFNCFDSQRVRLETGFPDPRKKLTEDIFLVEESVVYFPLARYSLARSKAR